MRLLYFASSSFGGLADYAREQAEALAARDIDVTFLCAPQLRTNPGTALRRLERLSVTPTPKATDARLKRAWRFMSGTLSAYRTLHRTIREERFQHVLIGAFSEFFSPLWSGPLARQARRGVVLGAVVHDPLRDTVIGPPWWHARSIAGAYGFLDHAFVHETVNLDTARPCPFLRTTVIPHGPYRFNTTLPDARSAREQLGLPPDQPVLLSFGHIRDTKNLDLVLTAMVQHPRLHLVVAGHEQSASQKPASFYRKLAADLGVASRCHWHARFISEAEIGTFFAASDYICLAYAATFRSASGVLNAAVQFRKPCLASSGPGPLRSVVERYDLGVWVQPDDVSALSDGLKQLLDREQQPQWDRYERENSWQENAAIVARTLFSPSPRRQRPHVQS